jgi:hypothetical protein
MQVRSLMVGAMVVAALSAPMAPIAKAGPRNGAFGPKGGVLDGMAVLGKRAVVNTLATAKLFTVPIDAPGTAGAAKEGRLTDVGCCGC